MKKIISMALAASMIASMAVSAFALTMDQFNIYNNDGTTMIETTKAAPAELQFLEYDVTNNEVLKNAPVNSLETVKPGTTYVAKITLSDVNEADILKEMNKVKHTIDWQSGTGSVVESTSIQYLRSDAVTKKFEHYFVVKIKADVDTSVYNLTGKVTFYVSSPNAGETYIINFNKSGHEYQEYDPTKENVVLNEADPDCVPVMGFTSDLPELKDGIITFEGVGEFHVDLADENDLYLGFNFIQNSDMMNKYNQVDHKYIAFPSRPEFQRTGTFYLDADKSKFVYAVDENNNLVSLNATYDEKYKAYKFDVRTFPKAFVVADKEMVLQDTWAAPVVPSPEAPIDEDEKTTAPEAPKAEETKPNPPTGR